jgi:hypothetical protein
MQRKLQGKTSGEKMKRRNAPQSGSPNLQCKTAAQKFRAKLPPQNGSAHLPQAEIPRAIQAQRGNLKRSPSTKRKSELQI